MKTPFFTLALATAPILPASAINLVFTDTTPAGSYPSFDPDGSRLAALVAAAETVWQDIIEDSGTINITYRYANLSSGLANGTATATSGGKPTAGHINIDNDASRTWYFDPTPTDNSEYTFTQRLYQDLTSVQQTNGYNSTPPALLEASYRGTATTSAPSNAQNGYDMYTTFLHEVGHVLGLSSDMAIQEARDSGGTFGAGDFDFDVPSSFANGNGFAVNAAGTNPNEVNDWGHIAVASFMCDGCAAVGLRRLPAATDILAIAACSNWTTIDLPRQDFLPRQGLGDGSSSSSFNNAVNWEGNQVPGAADEAYLRLGTLVGGGAGMDVNLTAAAAVRTLFLSDATDLSTGANRIDVAQTATIEFDGDFPFPQIFVQTSGELEANDLVVNGGELDMAGGLADIQDTLTLTADTLGREGAISGAGTVDVAVRLVNDGRISGTDEDGPTLTFTSAAASPWDLDGINGDGEVYAAVGNVTFASGALTDSFNGTFRVDDPHTLTVVAPWTLAGGGLIDLNGGDPDFATFAGGLITNSAGVIDGSGLSRITAPLTLSGSGDLNVLGTASTDRLELDGAVTISGGTIDVSADSTLQIDGAATISGGAFSIASGAVVDLNGTHTLSGGTYTGAGELSFDGTTAISSDVTVDCGILDFDGGGLLGKIVNLNANLTINSAFLDAGNNTFNSTINFGNSSGQVTVNGPASWTMAGVMNCNTGTTSTFSSVGGAPFVMSGTTNANQSTRWDAVATITGTINAASGHRLSLNGGDTASNPNRISGGVVNGPGSLRATTDSGLVGFGTIGADLDFLLDCLLQADDGTLTLSGAFISVPGVIGTADADGVLNVTNPWVLPAERVLEMNGGTVTGANIENQSEIRGHGTLTTSQVMNNGTISATDDLTLSINTTSNPDLDGTVPTETHTLNAVQGNIDVLKPVTDPFDGTLNVAALREIDFTQGWSLGPDGVANLTGGASNVEPAKLTGASHIFSGDLNCIGEVQLRGAATFQSSSVLNLPGGNDRVRCYNNVTVNPGATVSGSGSIIMTSGATLQLPDEIAVQPDLVIAGALEIAGTSPGQVQIGDYAPTVLGTLHLDLKGTPAQASLNDRVTSVKSVGLTGGLHLRFSSADLTPGQRWTLLSAPAVTGSFSSISRSGLPAGTDLRVVVTSTSVDAILIKSETYAQWVARNGLVGDDALATTDTDADNIDNGLEYAMGLDPKAAEPGGLPTVGSVNVLGTNYLSITARVNTLCEGIQATLAGTRSTDLVTFGTGQVVLHSSAIDDATQIRTLIWRSTVPLGSLPKEFLRVEATISP